MTTLAGPITDKHWAALVADGKEGLRQIEAGKKMADAGRWRLGDDAINVEGRYGDETMQRYAVEVGCEYKTLLSYRQVAERFRENSNRFENLRWLHHRRVVSRPDAERWLARAEAEGWSTWELKKQLEGTGKSAPPRQNGEGDDLDRLRLHLDIADDLGGKHPARLAPAVRDRWGEDEALRLAAIIDRFAELSKALKSGREMGVTT